MIVGEYPSKNFTACALTDHLADTALFAWVDECLGDGFYRSTYVMILIGADDIVLWAFACG